MLVESDGHQPTPKIVPGLKERGLRFIYVCNQLQQISATISVNGYLINSFGKCVVSKKLPAWSINVPNAMFSPFTVRTCL